MPYVIYLARLNIPPAGAHSGGLHNNRDFVESCVHMDASIPAEIQALLYDPQTSGGLLIALSASDAEKFLQARTESYIIGKVTERQTKPLEIKL